MLNTTTVGNTTLINENSQNISTISEIELTANRSNLIGIYCGKLMLSYNIQDGSPKPNNFKCFLNSKHVSNALWGIIFIILGILLALIIVTLCVSDLFFSMTVRASKTYHNKMLRSITRAKMSFFHSNPSGRILNRLAQDVGSMDEWLPIIILDVFQVNLKKIGQSKKNKKYFNPLLTYYRSVNITCHNISMAKAVLADKNRIGKTVNVLF